MKYNVFLLIFALIFVTFSAAANALYEPKDSVYFTKDDGEMSEEEKDLEAMYVYEQCAQHPQKAVYFDCGCIAGSFRIKREELGILDPQSTIVNKLFSDSNNGCANPIGIAGNAYTKCMNNNRIMRDRNSDEENEQYCSCVGKKAASEFTKNPVLSTGFIRNVNSTAFTYCADPNNLEEPEEDNRTINEVLNAQ